MAVWAAVPPQPREASFPKSQTVLLPSWETCTEYTAPLHIGNGDGEGSGESKICKMKRCCDVQKGPKKLDSCFIFRETEHR